MNYLQATEYLNKFQNFEKLKDYSKADFSLSRIKSLLFKAGINPNATPTIHIAGTKGKGSTAKMLSDLLMSNNYKVGLYTSPHIFDITERIAINNCSISKEQFVLLLTEIRKVIQDDFSCATYFEILTAMAFMYFEQQKLDFVILECGLGGRLDATNVVTPLLSIITEIELEHCSVLGRTLEDISEEKGGIIKPFVPVIVGSLKREVCKVLQKKASLISSQIYFNGKNFFVENIETYKDSVEFDFISEFGVLRKLTIELPIGVQVQNAALVCFAVLLLKNKISIDGEKLYSSLRQFKMLGRFTLIQHQQKEFVLDIAHTLGSVQSLKKAVENYCVNRKVKYFFGCNEDKNYDEILSLFNDESITFLCSNRSRAHMFKGSISTELAIAQILEDKEDILCVFFGSASIVSDFLRTINV